MSEPAREASGRDAFGLDDPELIAFAADARMVPLPPREGVLLRLSDMEIIDAIALRDGGFVLETSERGGPARPVASSSSPAPVRRELVLRLGSALRARQRLPRIAVAGEPEQLPDGFQLVAHEDAAELSWSEGATTLRVRFWSGQTGVSRAVGFARFARIPESELMAAFRDPRGIERLTRVT